MQGQGVEGVPPRENGKKKEEESRIFGQPPSLFRETVSEPGKKLTCACEKGKGEGEVDEEGMEGCHRRGPFASAEAGF